MSIFIRDNRTDRQLNRKVIATCAVLAVTAAVIAAFGFKIFLGAITGQKRGIADRHNIHIAALATVPARRTAKFFEFLMEPTDHARATVPRFQMQSNFIYKSHIQLAYSFKPEASSLKILKSIERVARLRFFPYGSLTAVGDPRASLASAKAPVFDFDTAMNLLLWQKTASDTPVALANSPSRFPAHSIGRSFRFLKLFGL